MIETERLFHRRFTRDDLPWLIENRSPAAVNRYLGGPKMQSPEALSKRLDFYINCYQTAGVGMCAMGLKQTGELIGSSGLQPLEDTGEIEVGYNLAEKFWRQGYGYEAAMGWLGYGFDVMGLERIVAVCHPDNTGSYKIMEKCGMRYEKTEWHYGQDCLYYAVERAEFRR
ncbi:MAG: GNAT family N-acetyltransferase [Acidobacteriota bacterium]|nr:MAG: GNAT family N-acetyltransferase [Acidobacteriota bacterium]